MNDPAVQVWTPPGPVRGVAVVLHGGRAHSGVPTSGWQLAVLRMLPFDWALRRAGRDRGLAVARVRYRLRGWNGTDRTSAAPVRDTRAALARLRDRFPDVPFALVGHSMGGRTAIYVADDPTVTVVVGLAPWIEAGDPVTTLTGRRVLLMHGDQDSWTSARASAQFADRVRGVADSEPAAHVCFVSVRGDGHAMLHRWRLWHRLTAGFVVGALWEPDGSRRDPVLDEALAGAGSLVA